MISTIEASSSLWSPADVVKQNVTSYVFDQDNERLVEVGNDGTALLGACSGRYNLAEILDAVGPKGRETTLTFLEDLSRRNFISWGVVP